MPAQSRVLGAKVRPASEAHKIDHQLVGPRALVQRRNRRGVVEAHDQHFRIVDHIGEILVQKLAEVREDSRHKSHENDLYWVFCLTVR